MIIRCFIVALVLVLLLVFNGRCTHNSLSQQSVRVSVERINKILDNLEEDPSKFISPTSVASNVHTAREIIATRTEAKFLIENPDISLLLMFKRLDKKELSGKALMVYFTVFGKTRSIESIPYVVNYLTSVGVEEKRYLGSMVDIFIYATVAVKEITHPFEFIEEKYDIYDRALFDQRLDIAQKLRQWYEDYKKRSLESK